MCEDVSILDTQTWNCWISRVCTCSALLGNAKLSHRVVLISLFLALDENFHWCTTLSILGIIWVLKFYESWGYEWVFESDFHFHFLIISEAEYFSYIYIGSLCSLWKVLYFLSTFLYLNICLFLIDWIFIVFVVYVCWQYLHLVCDLFNFDEQEFLILL